MVHLSNITKQYGNKVLFKNASFQINPGEKSGLVGPNGAGKSTIFRLITNEESADNGQISKPGKTVIGYFSQNIEEMSGRTVLEEVLSATGNISKIENRLKELEAKLSEPLDDDQMAKVLDEYGELQADFESKGGYEVEPRAKQILSGLGIHQEDQGRPTESFSGGWKMRIALAKILILAPDVLLMDEPTNHLDIDAKAELKRAMQAYKGTIVLVSHEPEFYEGLATKVWNVEEWIEAGKHSL